MISRIKHQLSLLLCNFVFSNENEYEFNHLESDIARLLKMVKYNNDQHKESQIFVFEIISSMLNGKSQVCVKKIEKYINTHKLDEDLRIGIVLALLFTDLSILNGTINFSYFEKIISFFCFISHKIPPCSNFSIFKVIN